MPETSQKTLVRLDPRASRIRDRLSELLGVPEEELIIDSSGFAPNLLTSYQKRFEMFIKGGFFCIDHMLSGRLSSFNERKKEQLRVYLTALKQRYNQELSTLEENSAPQNDYQVLLGAFCTRLVLAFAHLCNYELESVAVMLATAEEYQVLLEGRTNLVSVSKLEIGEQHALLVQREQILSPLSNRLRDEFWNIRECLVGEEGDEAAMPEWYLQLEPLEKQYLGYVLKAAEAKDELDSLFASYSSRMRGVLGPANFREHSYRLVETPTVAGQPLRDKSKGSRITSSMIASRDVSDRGEGVRLEHAARNLEIIVNEGLDRFISQRLEALALSGDLTEGQEINLPILVQTLVSPLKILGIEILPKDCSLMKDKKKAIEEFNRRLSGEISQWVMSEYPKRMSGTLPDGRPYNVNVMPVIYSSNHPLNYAKKIGPTPKNDPECLAIIELIEQSIRNMPHKARELEPLLTAYQVVLAYGKGDEREFFLSSLEQLLFVKIGAIPYGSCVSAKDRKALEFIHTDSMAIYFDQFGSWPQFQEQGEGRRAFVDIFAELYVTRHHHVSAGQNAPGAEGIKYPTMYLPQDIQTRISELFSLRDHLGVASLTCDDQLADNNELNAILRGVSSTARKSYMREVTEQLPIRLERVEEGGEDEAEAGVYSPEDYQHIYEKLSYILNAEEFWHNNTYWQKNDLWEFYTLATTYREPKGISKLKKILQDNESYGHQFSLKALELLATTVTYKPKNSGRYKSTGRFYRAFADLYYNAAQPTMARNALERFNEFYEEVRQYEERKRARRAAQGKGTSSRETIRAQEQKEEKGSLSGGSEGGGLEDTLLDTDEEEFYASLDA